MKDGDFVSLVKHYGKLEAQLANAKRDVKDLKRQLEQSEAEVAKLEQQKLEVVNQVRMLEDNNKMLQDSNAKLTTWIAQVLAKILDFCGKYKENIDLPKPPAGLPVSITNNFNGQIAQQIASAGCVVSDMQPKGDKPQENTDKPNNNDKQS